MCQCYTHQQLVAPNGNNPHENAESCRQSYMKRTVFLIDKLKEEKPFDLSPMKATYHIARFDPQERHNYQNSIEQTDAYKIAERTEMRHADVIRRIVHLNRHITNMTPHLGSAYQNFNLKLVLACKKSISLKRSSGYNRNPDCVSGNLIPVSILYQKLENRLPKLLLPGIPSCCMFRTPTTRLSGYFWIISMNRGISSAKCCPSASMVMA